MKIENHELMKEYFELKQRDYPTLSLEEMKAIVSSPYVYVKENMESAELPTIRLKYLGVFIVFQGRAKGILNIMNKKFKELKIEPKYYFQKKAILEQFLIKRNTPEDEYSDTEVD